MSQNTIDEENITNRHWWVMLGILTMTCLAGFFISRPFDDADIDTYYLLQSGVINMFMVIVTGMGWWRFYNTVREERIVVTRKYVAVILLALGVKYIYLTSAQMTYLTRCAPNILEECRKSIQDHSPLLIVIADLLLFSVTSCIVIFLIHLVIDPSYRKYFNGWISQVVKPDDDGVGLNVVKTNIPMDNKTMGH